jgi:transcription antitermination protein NusB
VKTKRREARILAMQALFQLDAQGDSFLDQIDVFLSEAGCEPDVVAYANELTRRAWSQRDEIDAMVGKASQHWAIHRMPPVDRSILRMSAAEMMQSKPPPPAVVIDEAIELGKQFGGVDSPQFINGVLDAVRKQLMSKSAESDGET